MPYENWIASYGNHGLIQQSNSLRTSMNKSSLNISCSWIRDTRYEYVWAADPCNSTFFGISSLTINLFMSRRLTVENMRPLNQSIVHQWLHTRVENMTTTTAPTSKRDYWYGTYLSNPRKTCRIQRIGKWILHPLHQTKTFMKHRKVDKSTVEYSYSIYCYILTFRKSPYYLIFEHIDNQNISNSK